jgi:hypothetical protein
VAEYATGVAFSMHEIPRMISLMVGNMERELAGDGSGWPDDPWEPNDTTAECLMAVEDLEGKREGIRQRAKEYSRLSLAVSSYGLRKPKKSVKYEGDEHSAFHPNWKHFDGKLQTSPVNSQLVESKKKGFSRMVVKESLIPGDTGWGLFASKDIRKGDVCCS